GQTKIAVFSVVNSIGAIVDRHGKTIRGNLDPNTGERQRPSEGFERVAAMSASSTPPGNTTLTVVITNQRLDGWRLTQLARQVHASMARAIQPFHCLNDGDVLFAVTTDEVDDPQLHGSDLGALTSELAWDAVLASVGNS
ncbi:MAG: 6-aminohexanoate hydrolase, partial [Chloroflexi bacterium]